MNVYCLEVTSWENDADNYQTKRYFTANKDTLEYLEEFLNLFRCDDYGNEYRDDSVLEEIILDFVNENKFMPTELVNQLTGPNCRSFINSLLGHSEAYDYGFIRAYESSKRIEITEKELNAFMRFKKELLK